MSRKKTLDPNKRLGHILKISLNELRAASRENRRGTVSLVLDGLSMYRYTVQRGCGEEIWEPFETFVREGYLEHVETRYLRTMTFGDGKSKLVTPPGQERIYRFTIESEEHV